MITRSVQTDGICDLVWLAKQRDLPTDNVVPLPTHNIDFYIENQ